MAIIIFKPSGSKLDIQDGSKILAAAIKSKQDIRYGCGALRCGTCAVKVTAREGKLSILTSDEAEMLEKLGLPTDGSVRMACRAKVAEGTVEIDLNFQDTYSP